jgi:hypothetical protein
VAPAVVMPYRRATVTAGATAMLLLRVQIPCWGLASGVGREAMSWSWLQPDLGRFRVVGTTVKVPARLPQDLVAEEQHSRLHGDKISLVTTAGGEGLLGASGVPSASASASAQAYPTAVPGEMLTTERAS